MHHIASNLKILEQICAEIFRLASQQINGTPSDMKVDPYTMAINDTRRNFSKNQKDQMQ
jgi:hypothetical protein